jgi:glycerol-3-phosphate dehydrogenase
MKKQKELDIDLPICKTVYDILYNEKDIRISVSELLNRPTKPE